MKSCMIKFEIMNPAQGLKYLAEPLDTLEIYRSADGSA